jgi:hemolysin D
MSLKHRSQANKLFLLHYWQTFRHYWQRRDSLGGNFFNEEEAEFLPAALSLQEKPVSRASRIAAVVLMALVIVLFTWAVVGRMDIIVSATGEIMPSGRTKTISAIEMARVKAIHVQEGQTVKQGDVLIELDASIPSAEQDKAMSSKEQATLEMARSREMIKAIDSLQRPSLPPMRGVSPEKLREAQRHLEGQFDDFITKLHRLDGLIDNYGRALPLATQQASDYKELAKNNDVSNHAYLEKEQARIELEGKLIDAKNQRAAIIAETKRVAYEAFTEGDKIAGASQPDVRKAAFHRDLLTLVAPVDGTVQQLTVHTVGGVVPPAQPLMLIVPKENQIEVEAKVENKDIGFVREGQAASVKVEAFQYTKYGLVPAHVTHISRDAIKADSRNENKDLVYSVTVALDKSSITVEGRDVKLSPGMSVGVDIKTGDRRVIEYILSPLLKMKRESLHER